MRTDKTKVPSTEAYQTCETFLRDSLLAIKTSPRQPHSKQKTMKPKPNILRQWAVTLLVAFIATAAQAADTSKPNIVFIMGDDVGMWNSGAYHRGMMAGRTPNLDKIAKEGMLFTDYYAEASCTAGRANFI